MRAPRLSPGQDRPRSAVTIVALSEDRVGGPPALRPRAPHAKFPPTHEQQYPPLATRHESQMGGATLSFLHNLNSSRFITFLEKLTGISGLIPDPHLEGRRSLARRPALARALVDRHQRAVQSPRAASGRQLYQPVVFSR